MVESFLDNPQALEHVGLPVKRVVRVHFTSFCGSKEKPWRSDSSARVLERPPEDTRLVTTISNLTLC